MPHQSIPHTSGERHNDLVFNDEGQLVKGSIEAICHEIVFGPNDTNISDLFLMLPMWTDIEMVLETILELAALEDTSSRLIFLLELILANMSSMLLDLNIFYLLSSMVDIVQSVEESKALQLRDALFSKRTTLMELLNYSHTGSEINSQTYAQQLRGGLTIDAFLNIDTNVLAAQIHLFHLKIFKAWSPINDFSLLFSMKYAFARNNPIMATTTSHPHFLCSLMMRHLFPNDPNRSKSVTLMSNVLTKWIELGKNLKEHGDMVGWLAIATVACSQAVCRLRDVWSMVSLEIYEIICRDWSLVMFDLDRRLIFGESSRRESSHILAPDGFGMVKSRQSVPYFGDICVHFHEKLAAQAKPLIDIEESRFQLFHVRRSLERWTSYSNDIGSIDSHSEVEATIPAIQECLYAAYSNFMASSPLTLTEMLEISLAYEPATSAQYASFYYSQRSPLSSGSYVSLLFTDVLHSHKLFERKNLLEAGGLLHKKASMSTLRSKASADPIMSSSLKNDMNSRSIRRVRSFPPLNATVQTTGFSALDTTSRNRIADLPNRNLLMRNVRDILNMGVKLYHIQDSLVLKSFKDDASQSSRPPSVIIENPSKRMSGSSRRLSTQFQGQQSTRSSLRFSGFPEGHFFESPDLNVQNVDVVAKSGTLERLIDLLVLGIDDFASKIDTVDMFDFIDKTTQRSFKMNMEIFTITFFGTFRSFCAPVVLLEYLRRRYVGAKSAAVSIKSGNVVSNEKFPDWSENCDTPNDRIEWKLVAKIQIGILEAFNLWVSEYFVDFANELSIRTSFLAFLQTADKSLLEWKELTKNNIDLKSCSDLVEGLLRKLRKAFSKRSYRPVDIQVRPSPPPPGGKALRFPSKSLENIANFCLSIDRTVCNIFRQVTMKDWLSVFEIFEVQSVDPSRMFSKRMSMSGNDDDLVIQDIFSFCATLHCLQSDDLMVSLLPKPVKKLYALHMNLVSWLVYHIADPSISRNVRVDRMMIMLKAMAICRKMMSSIDIFKHTRGDDQVQNYSAGVIPSFVETAIAAALVRPESRHYLLAWNLAIKELGFERQTIDSIDELIPKIDFEKTNLYTSQILQQPLTICVGWIFERMFELVCYVPNMSVEDSHLINFDKQRYVYNFLSNVMDLKPSHIDEEGRDIEETAYSLLSYDVNSKRLDRRIVKEVASRESKSFSGKNSKAQNHVFHNLVVQEMEKLRRDQKQHEALDRRQGRDQSRYSQMRLRNPSQHPQQLQIHQPMEKRNSRASRLGGLLKVVRPLSMAFFNGLTPPSPDRSVSPYDLPEIACSESRKPSLTVNLASCTVIVPPATRSMGIFRLVLEDGGEHLLQATSEGHMDEWVRLCMHIRSSNMKSMVHRPSSTESYNIALEKTRGKQMSLSLQLC